MPVFLFNPFCDSGNISEATFLPVTSYTSIDCAASVFTDTFTTSIAGLGKRITLLKDDCSLIPFNPEKVMSSTQSASPWESCTAMLTPTVKSGLMD